MSFVTAASAGPLWFVEGVLASFLNDFASPALESGESFAGISFSGVFLTELSMALAEVSFGLDAVPSDSSGSFTSPSASFA